MSPNAKINEAKSEIPSITNLARTVAFTTVENKIPNASDIIKKTDYDHVKITGTKPVNESSLNAKTKGLSAKEEKIAAKVELKSE